jgi:hypothetical protein
MGDTTLATTLTQATNTGGLDVPGLLRILRRAPAYALAGGREVPGLSLATA